MEDGNFAGATDNKYGSQLSNLYSDSVAPRITTNGHATDVIPDRDNVVKPHYERHEGLFKQRINPLKIHLGKRPFVDNSIHYQGGAKRKNTVNRLAPPAHHNIHDTGSKPVPKLIQRKGTNNQFHHALSPQKHRTALDGKPVPRLIPKSQLSQFKKGKVEKGHQFKEYAQYLGLQPMMQYKCSKCCAMFNTLTLLNEHQQVCRVQSKELVPSPEGTPGMDNNASAPSRVTKKVFLCSACGTYYENWNLFLHMREIHNRHICLFCLGMFSKAQKLAAHLTNKHNVTEHSFNTKEEFCNMYNDSFYLMCCTCGEVYSEQDDFFTHDCNNVKPKPVPVLVSKNAKSNIKLNKNLSITNSPAPPPVIAPDKLTIEPVKDEEPIVENSDLVPISSVKSVSQPKEAESHPDASHAENTPNDCDINNGILETTADNDDSTDTATESIVSLNSMQEAEHLTNTDKIPEEIDHSSVLINTEAPAHSNLMSKDDKSTTNEKDCGIKLKLSLNNSTKSPVIINSTVDPSVGRGIGNKPPSRVRRPPKRYEKDTNSPSQPLTPTIKMTICDKAESSFVKSTVIENKDDPSSPLVINNNLDTTINPISNIENINSNIYDNIEHDNVFNRVPKLTVKLSKGHKDKDASSDYTSDSDTSDKLMVDESDHKEKESTIDGTAETPDVAPDDKNHKDDNALQLPMPNPPPLFNMDCVEEEAENLVNSAAEMADEEFKEQKEAEESQPTDTPSINDEIPVTELTLDKALDKHPLKDLLKVFVKSTALNCIYCNHVRKIATNCEHLSLHIVAEHQFRATVNSITAEELLPETITARVRAGAPEMRSVFINLDTYDSVDKSDPIAYDHVFECFQCYYKSAIHKELYLHNRKIHQNILLCVMCKTNFYNYSELLCHLCPGRYDTSVEIKFRCYLCNYDAIPSTFRLMVHLRKNHHTCDVCLEYCHDQTRLSNHVWKHKLHHLCYRCGIAYRNKPDITRHLFWKHGTESVMCKKCLQKKWPHVYHFCTPPTSFVCEECSLSFTRAVSLRVHKRFHTAEFPHVCTEEGCNNKFVSKKLLIKHVESHKPGYIEETEPKEQNITIDESKREESKDVIPVIDLVNDKTDETKICTDKSDKEIEPLSKKAKKKKVKDSDLLLDVNLPELNLSESDSESDEEHVPPAPIVKTEAEKMDGNSKLEDEEKPTVEIDVKPEEQSADNTKVKVEEKSEPTEDEKSNEQKVLDIWDNFKKYQAKVERKKTPPLVPIRKHVCESDHDYCIIPSDLNGDDELDSFSRKIKKSPKKGYSSSSSSSSDSGSSCPCGSNCSCSSSSGSSSSSSSDSDSSHLSDRKEKKKHYRKTLPNRRTSCGSQQSAVDVMEMADTPLLIAEKQEPLIAESDLETEESDTDEEFYDEYPQRLANKLLAEKRNQLMLLASVAPSDNGSVSGDVSRCATPVKNERKPKKDKSSGKKKSKKKKKSKSSKKTSLKLNIPKEFLKMPKNESKVPPFPQLPPNKITISLQSNKVQLPESTTAMNAALATSTPLTSQNKKRASKRRRVPNKFYGYSSEEENSLNASTTLPPLLKPQLPPKLEWRKEDLPAPVPAKAKKEVPPITIPHKFFSTFPEPLRLTAPIPDPEPPRILMNTESMESSDSESSQDGRDIPEPPAHLNSGTSSLPYPFVRPPVRQAREGESVYCYCRCPYDEVSEMIACDAVGCTIEWFHFECVGIMVPPKGKWYCPECRKRNSAS